MAQLKGFVSKVTTKTNEYVDKKTGEKREIVNRSFNVEGVWLSLPAARMELPQEGKQVLATFHTDTRKVTDAKTKQDKYYSNHICDGYQYVA